MSSTKLRHALQLQREQNWQEAKALYQEILRENPCQSEAWHALGICYVEQQLYLEAMTALKKAIEFNEQEAIYHIHLANVYKKLGQIVLAKYHFEYAKRLEPQNFDVLFNFGLYHYDLGEMKSAEALWTECLLLDLENLRLLFALAKLEFQQQHYEKSKAYLHKLLKAHPFYYLAHKWLGHIHFLQEHYQQALNSYEYYLQHDELDLETLNNIGALYLRLNEDDKALNFFLKAYELNPNHFETLNNLASLYLKNDRYEIAENHYQAILKMEPNDSDSLYNSGFCNMSLGHFDQAEALFKKVLTFVPDHFDSLCNLGAIYYKKNQKQKALDYYQKALAIRKEDQNVSYLYHAIKQEAKFVKAPSEYIKNLFDNYAVHYDQHMKTILDYKVPELFLKKFKYFCLKDTAEFSLLDLGCGTGLMGEIFKPFAKSLIGVDLSERMLHYAKLKNNYDELILMDIEDYLKENPKRFDIIFSADCFEYMGDLKNIFEAIVAHLYPKGFFMFTVEANEINTSSFFLQENGRFCHHCEYIEKLAIQCAFQIINFERIIIRRHEKLPVYGYFVLLKKESI